MAKTMRAKISSHLPFNTGYFARFNRVSARLAVGVAAGLGAGLLGLAGCSTPVASPATSTTPLLPEIASGVSAKQAWQGQRFAVAAANPLATAAGYEILRAGGSALDAAIAVQMVLSLVEPQSSGLGGGAFLMLYDGQKVRAYDGRERAPQRVDPQQFLLPDGKPMPFLDAAASGASVGVPGVMRLLALTHRQHGVLPWPRLFEPAIRLAESGFAVSPRMFTLLASEERLKLDPQARAYFYQADGTPWPVGTLLRNPALAQVLRTLAQQGGDAFYEGAIARDIVARVQQHPRLPGRIALGDFQSYQALERDPLCTPWQAYQVCGFPPPSSGHLTMMQIIGMMAAQNRRHPSDFEQARQAQAPQAAWLHHYTEAARLAFADRGRYIGDPAYVLPPGADWRSLVAPTYLTQRAALIGDRSMSNASAGEPAPLKLSYGDAPAQPEYGTSHISIVDAQGRAVAMTTTIEAGWGARILSDGGTGLVGGFLLNNQLTDFSFAVVDAQGRPIANRIEPGKRPRSSMSPTLVFDADGVLRLIAGSPGGAAIIHFTAKTLWGVLDWGMTPQAAIALPNFGSFNGPTVLERGGFAPKVVEALQERGHTVQEIEMTSGIQALQQVGDGAARVWRGGADPRREGVVMGD